MEMACAYPRRKNVMAIMTAETNLMNKAALVYPVSSRSSGVPMGINALQNFRNATIDKNVTMVQMKQIATFLPVTVANFGVEITGAFLLTGDVMATRTALMVQMRKTALL